MNLTDKTYLELRDDIFNARYKPNELITERQIAEKYNVSKLTAGEVLHRLCSEGHLTSYPRSGYMVTMLTPKEIAQLGRIRFSIESLVMETICEEASGDEIRSLRNLILEDFPSGVNATESNTRFHMGMAELTKDRFLITILRDLMGSVSRVEQHIPERSRETWQNHHKNIVDALAERNAQKAIEYLKKDLDR